MAILKKYNSLTQKWETVGNPTVVDSALSTTSENPVQNKAITSQINSLGQAVSSKPSYSDIPTVILDGSGSSVHPRQVLNTGNIDTILTVGFYSVHQAQVMSGTLPSEFSTQSGANAPFIFDVYKINSTYTVQKLYTKTFTEYTRYHNGSSWSAWATSTVTESERTAWNAKANSSDPDFTGAVTVKESGTSTSEGILYTEQYDTHIKNSVNNDARYTDLVVGYSGDAYIKSKASADTDEVQSRVVVDHYNEIINSGSIKDIAYGTNTTTYYQLGSAVTGMPSITASGWFALVEAPTTAESKARKITATAITSDGSCPTYVAELLETGGTYNLTAWQELSGGGSGGGTADDSLKLGGIEAKWFPFVETVTSGTDLDTFYGKSHDASDTYAFSGKTLIYKCASWNNTPYGNAVGGTVMMFNWSTTATAATVRQIFIPISANSIMYQREIRANTAGRWVAMGANIISLTSGSIKTVVESATDNVQYYCNTGVTDLPSTAYWLVEVVYCGYGKKVTATRMNTVNGAMTNEVYTCAVNLNGTTHTWSDWAKVTTSTFTATDIGVGATMTSDIVFVYEA